MSAQFRSKNPTELLTIGTDMSLESSFIRTNWKTKSTTKFEFKTIFQNPTGGQICNPPMAQSLDCSKDGTKAIVGLGNGKCVLFDLTKKGVDSIIDILEGHEYSVHQCYFYKKFVCTAGLDDKIQLWDISVFDGKKGNKRAKVVWKYDHVMDDKRVNCIAIQEPDQLFIGDESNVIVGLTIKV
jgi:WD40 repeat protein